MLYSRLRLRHGLATRNGAVRGGVDRVHNGLVSGWFACGLCVEPGEASPVLLMDETVVRSTGQVVDRGDVPPGTAFLFRFAPMAGTISTAQVNCPRHPEISIKRAVTVDEWQAGSLAEIQSCRWPEVMGWWITFEDQALSPVLVIEGFGEFPLMANRVLSELSNFLGEEGLGGFSVDLGRLLGYAIPDGTMVSVQIGDNVVARSVVIGSPLGSNETSCWLGNERCTLGEKMIQVFGRYFDRRNGEESDDSWRNSYAALGFGVATDLQDQWARYLKSQGASAIRILQTLEERARAGLGVATISSLPSPEGSPSGRAENGQVKGKWIDVSGIEPEIADIDQLKVMVAGLTAHRSGLGQNARRSTRALEVAGIHACQAPFFPSIGGWNRDLGLIDNKVNDLGDHVVLLHSPMDTVVPTLCAQPALLASRKLVGFYWWETEIIPAPLVRSLHVVDEVWTATEFVAEAFRQVTSTPVRVVGHAVSIDAVDAIDRASLGIAENDFVVHFAFDANSTVARKNPGAAIRAFQKAFAGESSAKFVLKVRNWAQAENLAYGGDPSARDLLDLIANESRLRLVTGEHSHSYALGLIDMADCFISLHRSEGFGYGIAEAMLLNVPVVATGYSGSLDLTSPENSWLIPWKPVDVLPGEYFFWDKGMFWAEADVEAAADALREIRFGGPSVQARIDAARQQSKVLTSLERLSERYLDALVT